MLIKTELPNTHEGLFLFSHNNSTELTAMCWYSYAYRVESGYSELSIIVKHLFW